MSEPGAGHDQLSVIDGAVASPLQREQGLGVLVRSYRQGRGLPARQLAAGCVTPSAAEPVREQQIAPTVRPCLVVLDVGLFTVRCRWCRWASPGRSVLDEALAAFEIHRCEERSA